MSSRSLLTTVVVLTLVTMTVAGLVMAFLAGTGGGAGLHLGGRIALVEVDGAIMDDRGFLEDVRRLRRDGSVRGWVVAINSPGGSVAPSQSIYDVLNAVKTEDGVPVVASIGSVGASGGYYVALAADSILALPGSITGSIGVVLQYPNVEELLDKLGVRMEVVTAGEQKDLGSPFSALDEGDREILNALLTDVHEQFMEAVARDRDMPMEEVRPLADGRILSGRQARLVGLIDRLGNLEEALAVAGRMAGLGSSPRVVRPPREEPGWLARALLGTAVARSIEQLTARVSDPVSAWPTVKYMMH